MSVFDAIYCLTIMAKVARENEMPIIEEVIFMAIDALKKVEQTEPHTTCKKCKHYKYRTNCGWECEYDTFEECNYEPKCSEIIEAYSRGYTDGANAVKAMPQTDCSWK